MDGSTVDTNGTPVGPVSIPEESSLDIEVFKVVAEHYRQDLREYWVRNNMYLLITGILVSVFASLGSKEGYGLALPAFGLLVSIFWFAVARGSTRWLQVWRDELCAIDHAVDRFQVYHRVEQRGRMNGKLRSPSWVTQFLPLVVSAGWLTLLIVSVG
ncbi:hypothetical protein ACQP2X_23215 [Actinoplanes sp. CA-131856]